MIIPSVNNRETLFPMPNLINILGIPNYESLHQMQLDIKTNALSVYSKLGGGTHEHLGLLITNSHYALISNATYVRLVHPGIIHIPNNAARIAADVL